ncbi:sulfurase [Phaeobacter sp.]|uniref:MOSC domain-containing protein n=1 Tax=Phaeobacter sp. TaxID=1902409 RepID=UPI0025D56F96|nr:sulfurase [Phaeobacter sp.]
MPILKETDFQGEIVWLGHVPEATVGLRSKAGARLDLTYAGIEGERHYGEQRQACGRVRNLHPAGTEIRNLRQLSILSQEDLELIAQEMGMAELDPTYLGATLVLRGIPDLSHLPPSSRLQGPDGVTLTVDLENRPCIFPGKEIEKDHKGFGAKFKPAAKGRRGVMAWVERPGRLELGQSLRLFVPDQPAWSP